MKKQEITCNPTEHSFFSLNVMPDYGIVTVGSSKAKPIKARFILYCSQCGEIREIK
jgi:hypothetical protein